MDTAEFGEKTRAYVTEYIKFADAKAGAIVALVGLVGGALGVSAKPMLGAIASSHWSFGVLAVSLGVIAAVSGVMCLWHALDALSPRAPQAQRSLASFPDIARIDVDEYVAKARGLDTAGMANEYALVNSTIASIATAKFGSIRGSIWWLRILLLSTYVAALVYAILIAISRGGSAHG